MLHVEDHAAHCRMAREIIKIYMCIYTRAPHGCRIGKLTSMASRVITFKQVDINALVDLVTNRIRACQVVQGKDNAECQFSVFVSVSLKL